MNPVDEETQMKLLQIDSSARTSSVTRQLTARFADEWRKNRPAGEVIQRDLSATTLPVITDDWNATHLETSKLMPAQRSYLSSSDELIEELLAADLVVIGAPMYNFSISSLLKSWIDQVVRIGKTVVYGPNGREGLLGKKNVVVITSRGGAYEKGTAMEAFDFQEPYLRHILGFIGLTDVTFIHAENQAREEAAVFFAAAAERILETVIDQNQQVVTLGTGNKGEFSMSNYGRKSVPASTNLIEESGKMVRKLFATDNNTATVILRLVLGVVFFAHGAQKMLGWFGGWGFSATMGFFTGIMHIPAPLAFLAIVAEFFGGLGLILGLLTRIAAFGIGINMIVAIMTVHSAFGFFINWSGAQKGEGFEYHLLVIAMAAFLMIRGAGALSVDRIIAGRRREHGHLEGSPEESWSKAELNIDREQYPATRS
jgi:FMN-dependent NADH-azoreductase/uncharacterized membrane protein YphA (DoxX/SURF4 family)